MNMTKYSVLLEQVGLNENESKIYEYLLNHGGKTASELSRAIGISRTNMYHVLEQLEKKLLIEKSGMESIATFHAEHPRSLQEYIAKKEQDLQRNRSQIESVMQDMIADYELSEKKVGVFRFEGKKGMEKAYEEMLKDRVHINSIQNRQRLRQFIPEYNPRWVSMRRRYKIFHRIISPSLSKGVATDDEKDLREVRYIDRTLFPFDMDLKVTKKKVLMTTFKKETAAGMIIVDPEVIRNYMILFQFLWNIAKQNEPTSTIKKSG